MASFCLICARRYSRLLTGGMIGGKSEHDDEGDGKAEEDEEEMEEEIDGSDSRDPAGEVNMLPNRARAQGSAATK